LVVFVPHVDAQLQFRIQKLETIVPSVAAESPDTIRMKIALETLSTETLEQLCAVAHAQAAGVPLTEAQMESARLFDAALSAVPMPTERSARK
jgi:hypothetical protein